MSIVADDGSIGVFDMRPYLNDEVFEELRDPEEFAKVINGGYFVEWACGADLSADTIEARWRVVGNYVQEMPDDARDNRELDALIVRIDAGMEPLHDHADIWAEIDAPEAEDGLFPKTPKH